MSPKTTPSAPTTSAGLPAARLASASMRQAYVRCVASLAASPRAEGSRSTVRIPPLFLSRGGGFGLGAVEERAHAVAAAAVDLEEVGDRRVDLDPARSAARDHARPREHVVADPVDPLGLEADLVPLAMEAAQVALDVLDPGPRRRPRYFFRLLPDDVRRDVVDDPADVAAVESRVALPRELDRVHRRRAQYQRSKGHER